MQRLNPHSIISSNLILMVNSSLFLSVAQYLSVSKKHQAGMPIKFIKVQAHFNLHSKNIPLSKNIEPISKSMGNSSVSRILYG